jgi:MOSC domain-containing protein YiiM
VSELNTFKSKRSLFAPQSEYTLLLIKKIKRADIYNKRLRSELRKTKALLAKPASQVQTSEASQQIGRFSLVGNSKTTENLSQMLVLGQGEAAVADEIASNTHALPSVSQESQLDETEHQTADVLLSEPQLIGTTGINEKLKFDTTKLAEKTKLSLSQHKITTTQLAGELGVSYSVLAKMINHPKPWNMLKEVTRENYRKLNAWLINKKIKLKVNSEKTIPSARRSLEPSARRSLEPSARISLEPSARRSLEPPARRSLLPSARRSLEPSARISLLPSARRSLEPSARRSLLARVAESGSVQINTVEVAKKTKLSLNKLKITIVQLTGELGISYSSLASMINHPKPWNMLKEVTRENYRKLNAWLIKNNIKLKVKSKKTNPVPKRPSITPVAESGSVQVSTVEVAKTTKLSLNQLKITIVQLTSELGICYQSLYNMINRPKPWNMLREITRENYRKLYAWLINKNIKIKVNSKKIIPAANKSFLTSVTKRSFVQVNTFKVAKEITRLLRKHSISPSYFAAIKLKVSKACFDRLVAMPPPRWEKLNWREKKVYRLMQLWTLATPSQISVFKKSLENIERTYRAEKFTQYKVNGSSVKSSV